MQNKIRLNGNTYTLHHSATARGYTSRVVYPDVKPYSGKFGKGYTLHYPRFDTTQYHTIAYYIEGVQTQ